MGRARKKQSLDPDCTMRALNLFYAEGWRKGFGIAPADKSIDPPGGAAREQYLMGLRHGRNLKQGVRDVAYEDVDSADAEFECARG